MAQNVVGDAKRFKETGSVLDAFHQPFIRDHDDGVHASNQLSEGLLGLLHPAFSLERERLGDHRDGERAQFAGEVCDNRRSSAAGAASQSGSDENHVRAVERFQDFFGVLQRSFAADLRISARSQSFRQLGAELQFYRRL